MLVCLKRTKDYWEKKYLNTDDFYKKQKYIEKVMALKLDFESAFDFGVLLREHGDCSSCLFFEKKLKIYTSDIKHEMAIFSLISQRFLKLVDTIWKMKKSMKQKSNLHLWQIFEGSPEFQRQLYKLATPICLFDCEKVRCYTRDLLRTLCTDWEMSWSMWMAIYWSKGRVFMNYFVNYDVLLSMVADILFNQIKNFDIFASILRKYDNRFCNTNEILIEKIKEKMGSCTNEYHWFKITAENTGERSLEILMKDFMGRYTISSFRDDE